MSSYSSYETFHTLAHDSRDPSLVLRSLLHHFLGSNALHSLVFGGCGQFLLAASKILVGRLDHHPIIPVSSLRPLGVEASCCVVLVPSPVALGELSVIVSVSVSPSRSVLVCSPAFPCSRQYSPVCQYVQAPPMILFGPAQCLRRRFVLLVCSPAHFCQ